MPVESRELVLQTWATSSIASFRKACLLSSIALSLDPARSLLHHRSILRVHMNKSSFLRCPCITIPAENSVVTLIQLKARCADAVFSFRARGVPKLYLVSEQELSVHDLAW